MDDPLRPISSLLVGAYEGSPKKSHVLRLRHRLERSLDFLGGLTIGSNSSKSGWVESQLLKVQHKVVIDIKKGKKATIAKVLSGGSATVKSLL